MTQGSLGLTDAAFWNEPFDATGAAEKDMVAAGGDQVRMDAPLRVALGARPGTLPALVVRAVAMEATMGMRFAEHAVLVATSLERNRTFATTLEDPEEAPPKLDLSRFNLPPPTGTVIQRYLVDLRERLELPWDRPDTLVVRLVLRDRVLGEARVELVPPPGEYRDPEVERHLEEIASRPAAAPIWPPPGEALPRYDVLGAPPLPAERGIVLDAERLVTRPGAPCVLRGSFRLPIRVRDRTSNVWSIERASGAPNAVVPITIVLLGSRYPFPYLLRFAVPSYAPLVEVGGAFVATGHFAVDLQTLVNLHGLPQTYFLHAFSGEYAATPRAMAIVEAPGD